MGEKEKIEKEGYRGYGPTQSIVKIIWAIVVIYSMIGHLESKV